VWTPSKIEIKATKFDLSSSSFGTAKVKQVICDGVTVVNAANYVAWNDYPLQFMLCEQCLYQGCATGGCVSVRRANDRVIILPAFDSIYAGEWEASMYGPPLWLRRRGCLSLTKDQWAVFSAPIRNAPRWDELEHATTNDLLRLFYFQSPRMFLPDYTQPAGARWDTILCTNGDTDVDVAFLRQVLSTEFDDYRHVFCKPSSESYTVSAFLDCNKVEEWPICSSENPTALYLADDLHIQLIKRETSLPE
jgi:hypothetical protein